MSYGSSIMIIASPENASDVVWKLDNDYRFTYISPADERLRGYRADEVIGHHVFESFNEEGIATVKRMARLRGEAEWDGAEPDTVTFEAEHRCKDGRWLWAEIRYTAERDANGTVTGFYGMTREITKRKQAEDEALRAKAAAEDANKAKSEFLALISHEIRTPLNSLVGFSSLARKATDPAKLDQYHAILETSSRSLMALLDTLLDMSKIEAGRLEFEAVPLNLRSVIENLEVQYRLLAEEKKLEFKVVVADSVPTWVLGDVVRLRQVLVNLLSNAVKFTESGAVSCTVSVADRSAEPGHSAVRFEICDSGIGIPESKMSYLFQPFRQLDPTITRKFGGTGLGLAIVHSLVTMMNGSISVQSREGVGSCFVIELPLPETIREHELIAEPVLLTSGTVLVVEDNRFNGQLLEDLLTEWGQQVILADDGWQALQLMEQIHFDLLLLDIRMPGIDGIEVARRIRQKEREQSVEVPMPIIAITADTDAATRETCLAAGINELLAKPVKPDQLARAIAACCRESDVAPPDEKLLLNLRILNDFANSPERARRYAEMLKQDIDVELQRLQTAFESDDSAALGRAAHTLKGLCVNLASREPAKYAAWLQENALLGRSELVERVIKKLHTTLL